MCIPMASFLEAVDCSFRFNMFRVGRHVFEQRMGSPMGSPISPSLCHAVVPDFEHRVFSNILLLVPKLMRDNYRLRTAAEAWGNFWPHADFDFPPDDSAVNKVVCCAGASCKLSVSKGVLCYFKKPIAKFGTWQKLYCSRCQECAAAIREQF